MTSSFLNYSIIKILTKKIIVFYLKNNKKFINKQNTALRNRLSIWFAFILLLVVFYLNTENIKNFYRANVQNTVKIKVKEFFLGKQYLEKIEFYSKSNYNQLIFPKTQFEELAVTKIYLRNFESGGGGYRIIVKKLIINTAANINFF